MDQEKIIELIIQHSEGMRRIDALFVELGEKQRDAYHQQLKLESKIDKVMENVINLSAEVRHGYKTMEKYSDDKISNAIVTVSNQFDRKLTESQESQDRENKLTFSGKIGLPGMIKISVAIVVFAGIPLVACGAIAAGTSVPEILSHVRDVLVAMIEYIF